MGNGLTKIEPINPSSTFLPNNNSSQENELLKKENGKLMGKDRNTIQILGEIPYSFVCSYDYRLRTRMSNKKS